MADLKFRDLRADEIDVRISTVKDNGMSLLLYKDARCDMNILDETVGSYNWQRSHIRDNANCIVSIWDDEKKQWISKEDVGTESNTEAQKGLASDSFKRACFNWGIGRELYTAPFIWISSGNYDSKYDKFIVQDITIEDKKIVGLSIYNISTKKVVYTYGKTSAKKSSSEQTAEPVKAPRKTTAKKTEEPKVPEIQRSEIRAKLKEFCIKNQVDQNKVIKDCGLNMNSTDADFEKAYDYALSLALSLAAGGDLPFEIT